MQHPDVNTAGLKGSSRRLARAVATVAVTGATAVALGLSGGVSYAQPVVPPPPAPATDAPAPAPVDPNAPAPPVDPNAPPAPAPPPPPEPGRLDNAAGGFSYVLPAGWQLSENTQLSYGQALLTKVPANGAEAPTDTSVLLGRLDLKLFAGAEEDNAKAAARLASDMGEFFMPFAGTRLNQESGTLDAAGMPGAFSSYEVKFTDTTKPNGQIWAGVVGATAAPGTPRGQRSPERWFVVWLGSANQPVDKPAATTLTQSIRPYTPPPPPEPAPVDPNAPPPPVDPNAPPARPGIGVPVPVTDAPPEMLPPA